MNRSTMAKVAALAGLIGGVSWWGHAASRVGRVELTNDGPPLLAQLLPESGDVPLGMPFDVVRGFTLCLPAGDYRLRVHGTGRLGRTFRLAVTRGETRSFALALDEGRLLGQGPKVAFAGQPKILEEPIPFAGVTLAADPTSGRADLFERSPEALIRRDPITGKATWEVRRRPTPPGSRREPTTWMDDLIGHATHPLLSRLVEQAADLDGDGIVDPVWALSNSAALLAVAGKDGSILWNYTATLDGPGGPRPIGPDQRPGPNPNRWMSTEEPVEPGGRWRQILGASATPDIDGDGTTDLIATLTFSETEEEVTRRTGFAFDPKAGRQSPPALQRRIVVAVSGRSGRSLWTRPLDAAFTTLAPAAWERPVEVLPARGWVALPLIDGDQRWVAFDAATGQPRLGPIDLGSTPVRPIQYADLDGDGTFDLLVLGPGVAPGQQTLTAFAGSAGRVLWSTPVRSPYAPVLGVMSSPRWPLVADLDGDGRPEVAVADTGPLPPGSGYRGLRLLDGATGQPRWTRPMRPETQGGDGLVEVLDAPDVDGDGVRDLVAASMFLGRAPTSANEGSPPVPERAYVDALSGRDGRPLWWWNRDQPTDKAGRIRPLRWWGRGPDDWPLLAVGLGGHDPRAPFNANNEVTPVVHNLEASTGRDAATAVGLDSSDVADLDGDGLLDLWGETDGQLRAFRGEPPEAWRALGRLVPAEAPRSWPEIDTPPAADLDGDGIGDVLGADLSARPRHPKAAIASHALGPALAQGFPTGGVPGSEPSSTQTAVARSGRDGRVLWTTTLDESWLGLGGNRRTATSLTAHPLPGGDLDGDGTPDVIAQTDSQGVQPGGLELNHAATLPLRTLSGRSGRRLWSAGPLPLGFRAFGDSQVSWSRPLIIEPGAAPDLVVGHLSPFAPTAPPSPGPNTPRRLHLARVAGRTGEILWDVALSEEAVSQWSQFGFIPHFGDVDGDGALDVVVAIPTVSGSQGPGYELRALALRDGRPLWTNRLDPRPGPSNQPTPLVADLDGDRRAEVVVDGQVESGGKPSYLLQALDGRDGQVRWAFRADGDGPQAPVGWHFPADLDGQGRRSVVVTFTNWGAADFQGVRRLVVLDAAGRVRADRDLVTSAPIQIRGTGYTGSRAVDLTGDGRDEILFFSAGRLRVWGPDLREMWSLQQDISSIDRVLAGSAGRPATLLSSEPVQALDGTDGHLLWAGHRPQSWWGQFRAQLLDPGASGRPPLLISQDLGATICRRAILTTPQGAHEPPRGARVTPGLARADPRWTRPLPWVELAYREDVRLAALPAVVLAVLNVGLPLVLLRLVAGRRVRGLRLVLAVPAAATLPLIAFKILEPSVPALPAPWPSSPWLIYLLATLAGVPALLAPVLVAWGLARRRWRLLAWLAGLTAPASLAVAAAWLARDRQTMPPMEHYDYAGWYWVVALGSFAASILVLAGWSARGSIRPTATPRPTAIFPTGSQ